jgi:hydroxymethylpyrimidine pyrophosphatase-like HAD family hydrolase
MYFVALATDYDGTLAEDGVVAEATLEALGLLKQSGRKLILVSGRELPDLRRVFSRLDLFDLAVLENGALLFNPASGEETALGDEPPARFVEELQRRKVSPLSVGRSIVATWEPNETIVLETIRDLGLELQIVFNKGAVMVLPAGVNKASGLAAALSHLRLSPLNVVGIGDAENDHAFLRACGCSVAVANALPMVKADADIVTETPRGAGVVEIIEQLLDNNLAEVAPKIQRQTAIFGHDAQRKPVGIHPQCGGVLIAGASSGGKTTAATGCVEQMIERGLCIIDPEGDYEGLEGTVTVGDAKTPPRIPEVLELFDDPRQNVVVNLLGIDLADRPRFLSELLPPIARLRVAAARPHWVLIDEAHHLLPSAWAGAPLILPREFTAYVLITVDPEHVSPETMQEIQYVMALGNKADDTIQAFCKTVGDPSPMHFEQIPKRGQAFFWNRRTRQMRLVSTIEPCRDRQRHKRKYAEGEISEAESFYFRGPDRALNLRAQNLVLFMQIAEGVDDQTWIHHLHAGDYSRWLREQIKDDELAEEVSSIEHDKGLSPAESRSQIKDAIARRYTGPA